MTRLAEFERRVMPHLDAAYNLARWLTRDEHDAQDVVQDSFVRALRYFERLRGTDARPWLLGIVRNTCYTWLEKNRPADLVAVDDIDSIVTEEDATRAAAENPEVIVLQSANRKLVNQALEDLPVGFREVIVMREIEDMSYKDIAAVAGIPMGTVMSRLSRAREMLKGTLESRMRKAS